MPSRRRFLRRSLFGAGLAVAAPILCGCQVGAPGAAQLRWQGRSWRTDPPELGPPDAHGLRLPPGCRGRVVAASGSPPIAGGAYRWHPAPDGGACFTAPDDGWIYVSNNEMPAGQGGVGALRFDAAGRLVDAYPLLAGTSRNCAGGPTPWNSWLSCEEVSRGRVWECDPLGRRPAAVRPALGVFAHEAAAVDPERHQVYLTEDRSAGRFYRFSPDRRDGEILATGTLEVAGLSTGSKRVTWHALPDPSAVSGPTRFQVTASSGFAGGEGAWFHDRRVYFTTKGDNRLWAYDVDREVLDLVYDGAAGEQPVLTGVDNVTASADGDLLVAEDGGNMQIVALTADGGIRPVVELVGHRFSEVAGPAFDPSGTRLYFSSQRGRSGRPEDGLTFEVTGPLLG